MRACDIKNKILIMVFILTAFFIAAPLCRTPKNVSAASLSDNAVIVLSGSTDGETVSVEATLVQNTGLHSLTVELSYDTDAMTLVNVVKGDALSSLNYITTDVTTEKGYSITPFLINWLDSELNNDSTTGLLFKMEFSVKDHIQDGKYTINLLTDVQPNTYILNGVVKTKNVLASGVQVEIKGNKAQSVDELIPENEKSNILLWISISVAALAVTGLIVVIAIKIKGKRAWTKIE